MDKRSAGGLDMTKGPSLPLIWKFTVPILLGSVFQQLYNVVDGIVVGQGVSTEAQAAVGIGFPVIYMLTSIFLGIGLGASVLVSQCFGNKDKDGMSKTVTSINAFQMIASPILMVFGMLSAAPFLRLLNCPDSTFADAHLYMFIYYIGLLPQFGYNVNASIMQGMGDSKTPLYILVASSVLHILLDYLLVMVIPLGVAGVAVSTVVSQLFSWVFSIIVLKKKYPELDFKLFRLKIDKSYFMGIIKIGLPIGLQNALFSVGIMIMQPLINGFGAAYIAGYNNAVKVDGFVFMPVSSLASGVTTFVAQNTGAGLPARVKEGVGRAAILSVAVCALMCAVVIPFRDPLMAMFNADPEVIYAGNQYLLRVIPLYIISAMQYLYIGVLRGMGKTVIPTIASIVSLMLARVPSAFVLTNLFGPDNMHWCYAIGWVLGLCILVPYYYGIRRKNLRRA